MKNRFCKLTIWLTFICLLASCSESGSIATKTPASKSTVTATPYVTSKPEVAVVRWGPQSTKAGVGFAVQQNGNSALWFEQRGIANISEVEVWFDKTRLPGIIVKANEVVTAELPKELISTPGQYPVYMRIQPSGKRVELGSFEVTP